MLAKRQVGVSHNPESNMKLASGTAPVPTLRKAGVAVGLGTDGAASNNDLDMFEAMRQAAFLHKLQTGDPRALPARTALEMATIDGARALGMDRQIGSLEAGKRADLSCLDARAHGRRRCTIRSRTSSTSTRGDDVRTTIVNGKGADARPQGAHAERSGRADRGARPLVGESQTAAVGLKPSAN